MRGEAPLMNNDISLPADSNAFDQYFEKSLASMAPDLDPSLLGDIMPKVDAWRQGQSEVLSRSDAVRRLIDLGIEVAVR